MDYQETGRFGRITKNLRKCGFEKQMPEILSNSIEFTKMNRNEQNVFIEKVLTKMQKSIGNSNMNLVLFKCGEQCCGKAWSNFVKNIWYACNSNFEEFIVKLNVEESKYNTIIEYDLSTNRYIVRRQKCICGLINKGRSFKNNKSFCNCSIGHMDKFFNSIGNVSRIEILSSIMNGDKQCEWNIFMK